MKAVSLIIIRMTYNACSMLIIIIYLYIFSDHIFLPLYVMINNIEAAHYIVKMINLALLLMKNFCTFTLIIL